MRARFRDVSEVIIRGRRPESSLVEAIYTAAAVLDKWECYLHEGRYHFSLGGGYSVALSLDSAERIRVELCRLTRPVATMWALPHRQDRLAGLVRRMSAVPEAV
jgi:hypothetical protein